jgi:hypothetical protein
VQEVCVKCYAGVYLCRKCVLNVTLERPCTALDFELDGVMVAVGTTNGRVLVYDVRNIKAPLHDFQVTPLASKQCCGSGMFIPDPNFFHPRSRIRIKEFKYFNPKNGL